MEELDNEMDEQEDSSEVDQDIDKAMHHLFPKPELEGSVSQESCSPSAWAQVEELLRQLPDGKHPIDNSLESTSDQLLNRLSYKDFPALRRAKAKLTVKSKDKKLDVFFRSRITAMVATLNLYMDPDLNYSWRDASLIAAKAAGRGINHVRNLQSWIRQYLHSEKLPLHRYGTHHSSILEDEDFAQGIQLHLTEIAKKGYICAQDVVDYVATPEVQAQLGMKAQSISVQTARRWLRQMSWRYTCKKNGMYIDGHEREDIVAYWNGFLQCWKEYEKQFVVYDNDGKILSTPTRFPIPQGVRFRLILVTHDKSTFYQNDRRKTKWSRLGEKATTEQKGEGQSLMASDFLTLEWGHLVSADHCWQANI